jgi:hypothetical protein
MLSKSFIFLKFLELENWLFLFKDDFK